MAKWRLSHLACSGTVHCQPPKMHLFSPSGQESTAEAKSPARPPTSWDGVPWDRWRIINLYQRRKHNKTPTSWRTKLEKVEWHVLPSGNFTYIAMAIYGEFSHSKWWFSIAMLNYERVHWPNLWISHCRIYWKLSIFLFLCFSCESVHGLESRLWSTCRGVTFKSPKFLKECTS